MKKLFCSMLIAVVCCAQTVITVPSLTVSDDAIAAIQAFMLTQVSGTATVLAAPVGLADASITVADATLLKLNQVLLIEKEAMRAGTPTGNVVPVTRGVLGSTAVIHANKLPVQVLKYATVAGLFAKTIAQVVSQIMDAADSPTVATQKAAIAAAQVAIQAAKEAAVK